MNIIEHLKDKSKAQPFGLRTGEERECLKAAGKKNCLVYAGRWEGAQGDCFYIGNTYVLKPDYQPEPEYVDIEIEGSDESRLILAAPSPVARYWGISHACEDPTFVGFYSNKTRMSLEQVANAIRASCTVVARFVKEAKCTNP